MPVHYATYFGFTKFVDLVMRGLQHQRQKLRLGDWGRLLSFSLRHKNAKLSHKIMCSYSSSLSLTTFPQYQAAMRKLFISSLPRLPKTSKEAEKSSNFVKRSSEGAPGSGPSTSSPERKKRKPNNHSGLDALAYVASKKSAKKTKR